MLPSELSELVAGASVPSIVLQMPPQWSNLAPVLGRFSVLMVCPWEMRRGNRMVKVWFAHGQTSVGLL